MAVFVLGQKVMLRVYHFDYVQCLARFSGISVLNGLFAPLPPLPVEHTQICMHKNNDVWPAICGEYLRSSRNVIPLAGKHSV